MLEEDQGGPWYKQVWAWFIIAILALAVILGIGLLIVAMSNQDSMVRDNYYKEGRAINMHLGRDQLARQYNLNATFEIDDLTGEIRLELDGDLDVLPSELRLDFISPSHAERDQSVTLGRVGRNQYAGQLETGIAGRHYLDLSDPQRPGEQGWRLTDEAQIEPGQQYQLTPR